MLCECASVLIVMTLLAADLERARCVIELSTSRGQVGFMRLVPEMGTCIVTNVPALKDGFDFRWPYP